MQNKQSQHLTQHLNQQLDYKFKSEAYLKQALTHRSAGTLHNERLEYLGDSVLNFVISNDLYKRYPELTEGELSRLRAHLVKGETLASIARELGLGGMLYLGAGEVKNKGAERKSTLADALEAIFGAVFLDAGFSTCEQVILRVFQKRLKQHTPATNIKDPKTALQEYMQAQKMLLPTYTLTHTEGEDHRKLFYISCTARSLNLTEQGVSKTRRGAEQIAAQALLDKINKK
ncbi:MAG: ribonuclease III [Legionellaceae bacterium]|nr:ribonuclease III [Legionellaceae bacterium]